MTQQQTAKEQIITPSFVFKKLNKSLQPFYEREYGSAYLGDSLELMKKLPDDSVNLIVTSPPFALTSKKEYGKKFI